MLWSASVSFDPSTFRVTSRESLFGMQGYRTDVSRLMYDVGPDGRFLMISTGVTGTPQLVLVRNWFEEVKAIGR